MIQYRYVLHIDINIQYERYYTAFLPPKFTQEQGKTIADAKGDIFRGLEVVPWACWA